MKVADLVVRNKRFFVITTLDVSSEYQTASLVEVNPDAPEEHLNIDTTPILISMKDLQVNYKKV